MKKILRPVTKILFGTASAQALSLLLFPVVSRLYTPANYGVFGIVLAVIGVIVIVVTLQYQQAIVLPRLNSHGLGLFRLACLGALGGGVIATGGTIAYEVYSDSKVINDFGFRQLAGSKVISDFGFPLLVGLAVAATGIGQSIQGLVVRAKAFASIGAAAMLRVLVMAGLQIGLGLLGIGSMGLLIGYIAGEISAALFLWFIAVPLKMRRSRSLGWGRQLALIRRYRDFATFGTAQEAMNSASQGMPVILLGAYFGQATAGHYAFAIRILLAPGQLIANAVRQVLAQRFASNAKLPGLLRKEFKLATLGLAVPTILCALALMPWLPDAFASIFGEVWRESGKYGNWLIIWVAFLVFNAPSTVVMRTLRKQKESFMLNMLILATRTACLFWGGMHWTPIWTVAVFSLLGAFWNLVYIGLAWHFSAKLGEGK